MKEYGLYSGVTGGLVFGLGMCENEEEAAEVAEYYAEEYGYDITSDYIAERQGT